MCVCIAEGGSGAEELTWEQRGEYDNSDWGTGAAGTSVAWGQKGCQPSAECCHCRRGRMVNTVFAQRTVELYAKHSHLPVKLFKSVHKQVPISTPNTLKHCKLWRRPYKTVKVPSPLDLIIKRSLYNRRDLWAYNHNVTKIMILP